MNNPKRLGSRGFNRTPLAWLISCQVAMLMGLSGGVQARDFFNPALLELDNPSQRGADLTVFEDGNTQAPGKYRVDIYLNGQMVETHDLDFSLQKDAAGKESLQPCLSSGMLESMGVKIDSFPAIKASGECVNLANSIPQAAATFRFNQQRLDLSIPQAALNLAARDYVSPEKWDQGVPALLVNYNFSGANSWSRDDNNNNSNNNSGINGSNGNTSSYFLNLRSGANLGAWRLRNYSTWNRDTNGDNHWNSINTYLQRDIIALKSQMVLGESSSPSDVFDSVPFRGGQLASDDDMLPDSMKGYSPVVRGIARSNAQVTIRQNGFIIYQSYVAPGAFEIKDLYPTAGSGDLNVSIKEADGSEQNLVVPFASVPVLQREGRFKYSLTSGQYRSSNSDVEKTPFTQGTGIYGLPWGATIYGGVQAASKYQSIALGWGQNMGVIGALSADITQAWAKPENMAKDNGQSYRLRYGKSFVETGTNFSLASYRYSTQGFYTLQETLDTYTDGRSAPYFAHKKSRAELSLSQSLWEGAGSVSLSLVSEDYWNENRRNQSASVGYNNNWNSISYGLNYTYSKNGYDSNGDRTNYTDQIFALNISVPLSKWLTNSSYASYSMNTSRHGATSNTVGVGGTALPTGNLSYNVSQGYTSQGGGANGNANLGYRGGLGQVNVGYGYDKSQHRLNYGAQGGVMVHENGLTLSQSLGETVVLVKAPGAKGVNIANQTGVTTDWRGYAVVPYASAYRKNTAGFDTTTLPDDVDMTLTSQTVIPTRGAVVRAEFKPNIGQRVLMTLLMQGGAPVPFGATVTDEAGQNASIVGDSGQVYLTGMSGSGKLNVKWGNAASEQCQVSYSVPEQKENIGIQQINGQCL
ncbi:MULTISPECIES: fimbria/pilus outer membrane usher protein [unclassified Serratia (in: enterobacteria)]|uniref:fimbria/pilus outer membrane usher protein n=1 Tax=unclassified Serratia (in: enterobacteria) TaxID=2647522 RepID=UPI000503F1B4|nr:MULTISPECIES: fimbria/pilus outer membrane usher protein [unclassified Serratia (in: enterobacteria)]KFK93993.1 fimbrial assembly protein [Serratia sp. Ag2]KFK97717.1 fimbrial assembly protein [Serratia sp. Ag1]